jgi:hypothetical protein
MVHFSKLLMFVSVCILVWIFIMVWYHMKPSLIGYVKWCLLHLCFMHTNLIFFIASISHM